MFHRVRLLFAAVLPALALLATLLTLTDADTNGAGPTPVIISEVGWGGTAASSFDEWIELHNAGEAAVSLQGWVLFDSGGDVNVVLTGTIEAGGFYLLERTAEDTISDVTADQLFTNGLHNDGEVITLTNGLGSVVDTANMDGGAWPAGTGGPTHTSMERVTPNSADNPAGWQDNDGLERNGLDAEGNAVNGTPGEPNSSWTSSEPSGEPDLIIVKRAPPIATAGQQVSYHLSISNTGTLTATDVTLTDTFPLGMVYDSDDGGYPYTSPAPGVVVWHLGTIPTGTYSLDQFQVTATLSVTAVGTLTNAASIGTADAESDVADNEASAVTVVRPHSSAQIVIDALLYDGYEYLDADEAVQLRNTGTVTTGLGQWQLGDGGSWVSLPASLSLAPGGDLWLTGNSDAFRRQFGFAPDVVLTEWPGFANDGDEVILLQPDGNVADVLVYKGGDSDRPGWSGPTVEPYRASGLFAEEGQILYRRRQSWTGNPLTDTDTLDDWAQMTKDVLQGRKVRYPGWPLEQFITPAYTDATSTITVAVAPDNAYETILNQIEHANQSLQVEMHTLENVALAGALAAAAERGVSVTVLLEGAPAGGLTDQERYVCQLLEASGAACWFMIRDDDEHVHDRYRYLHAKFMIVDRSHVVISSENLSPDSMPADDKVDGTWGRRGVVLITAAPAVVERVQAVFEDDFAPNSHQDLFRWTAEHETYGAPPAGFVPVTVTGGTTYTVRYAAPVAFHDASYFSVLQAPENTLRDPFGLPGFIAQAGYGDTVMAQQLSEPPHWGGGTSNAENDPNPRLEAYVDAARRGATVWLLLDAFFARNEDVAGNVETCEYVSEIAVEEGLRLRCALDNPTGLGIHNKMILANIDGQGWIHVGSLNGTEQSNKGNREMALQVQSDGAYAYLAQMFEQDWPHMVWLPMVRAAYLGPADYPLISEVLYDPSGADDAEFIELVNPTATPVDLGHWVVADAVNSDDFEDARRFPMGTVLGPQEVLVIAASASGFQTRFGNRPDFEIVDSDPLVPELIDDPRWGHPEAILQLGNMGDEVLLRTGNGQVVDAMAYGTGSLAGTVSCAPVESFGHSLERDPFWRDTDECPYDFRDWPFPNPGELP